jgi:hypothetical protein
MMKNSPWTPEEEKVLWDAVERKISAARVSVRLHRSEASVKRRMRELGLIGNSRNLRKPLDTDVSARALNWLEACRSRDLSRVMTFYRSDATLECRCLGPTTYAGLGAIQHYWEPKLKSALPAAFTLQQVRFDREQILLDYLSFEAKPIRAYMAFDDIGRIARSECGPRGCVAGA